MSARFASSAVTANDLIRGDAVWLTADNRWTRDIREAEILGSETDALNRLLVAESQPDVVIGPYLVEVRPGADGPVPVHFREKFRTRGPSNYAHGKQETFTADRGGEPDVHIQ